MKKTIKITKATQNDAIVKKARRVRCAMFLNFLRLTIDQILFVESYRTYIRYANTNYGANRYSQGNYLINQTNSVK